jgi:CRISPR type III-associated protein (TIGR04423 family)
MAEHLISKAKYEGYIWLSDQTTPQVFDGNSEQSLTLTDGENPFVVEGQLWDAAEKRSISIRNVDGRYIVVSTDVTDEQLKEPVVTYIPHRIQDVKGLKFLRIWKEQADPLCEGMSTLQLQSTVFVGFEK